MGLFLICLILVAIGIVLLILYRNCKLSDWFDFAGALFLIFGTALSIVCGIIAITVQVTKQYKYENKLFEKQVIEYRIENEDSLLIGNELLYADITEFNNSIRATKKYHDSFWIGVFLNDKVATIDFIEIGG